MGGLILNQHGGNNVNDDQVLLLTREIAGIGTNVTTLLESFKEFKRELSTNYSTKSETNALKETFEREMQTLKDAHSKEIAEIKQTHKEHMDNHNNAPHKRWMLIATIVGGFSTFLSVAAMLYVAFHK